MLALIAKGLTNAQIAEELYLSIETVKTYVKRLYAKLDVHNRAQAAVAASTHQLTPRDARLTAAARRRRTSTSHVTPSSRTPARPDDADHDPARRAGRA